MTPRKTPSQLDREIAEALARPKEHLEYRSVGSDGEPWPLWLRATKNSCGVYVIRYKDGDALYAGSSNKNLYGIVTRHFQTWKRSQKRARARVYWAGYTGQQHDPGLVYQRGRCEVGIRVMACGKGGERPELEEEANLIHRLHPRDNFVSHPDGGSEDVVPF